MLKKALASSVNEDTIAYFFFPRLFGITSGFSRDFAENREIWGLNREKASKIVSLTIKSWDLAGLELQID
jgi:hypothetical protein